VSAGATSALEQLRGPETSQEQERRAGYLELFFDLVFVFAITQVTALILHDSTAAGFGRGVLVLWLVWWAWGGYAWMTNAISIESRDVRIAFLAVTLACFFVALAVPSAYGDDNLWFAVPYLVIRAAQVGLYIWGLRLQPEHQAAIRALAPWFLLAPSMVLVGAFLDGDAQIVFWLSAVAIDVAGALRVAGAGFRVSAAHFAERYGLFMIIALGESIVAIGVGAAHLERDTLFAIAVTVAFAGVGLLWWAYFDFLALGAERALARVPIAERGPLARDLYSFFHFLFVVGVILYAVGAEKTLEHPRDPLSEGGRWALGLGVAAYLLGSVVGRLRAIRTLAWERAAGAVAVLALVVVLRSTDALVVLVAVVGALALTIVVESVRLRELRRNLVSGE
jgi:low temperature requirement protein LtrA